MPDGIKIQPELNAYLTCNRHINGKGRDNSSQFDIAFCPVKFALEADNLKHSLQINNLTELFYSS